MNHHADAESRPGSKIPVDLTQPLMLTIHSPNGNIAVRAVDRPDVLIGTGDPDDTVDLGNDEAGLKVDAHGNRIEVRPNSSHGVGWNGVAGDFDLESVVGQITKVFFGGPLFSAKPGNVRIGVGEHWCSDIIVEVPRSITGRIELHSASGDVHIEGFTGEIALNSMSGALHAVRTSGALVFQAASGDLIVENASGRLTAHAASGDIRVSSAELDGFEVQTASGDVHVDALLAGDGPFRAQTASGDVRLSLRRPAADGEEPAATLAFHTVTGDAHVSPLFHKTDRRRWQAGSGDRGPRIDITTVNGDLTAAIASAERAFVPSPSPAVFADDVPPAAPADRPPSAGELTTVNASPEAASSLAHGDATRLAVLEAVERGEIDIDEALRRLDGEDAVANP